MSIKLYLLAIFFNLRKLHGFPSKLIAKIATVFLSIAFSTFKGSILRVLSSTSTKLISKLFWHIG